jgi:hypothetical protein
MKTTRYFDAIRRRSDRMAIEERWIEQVVSRQERERTNPMAGSDAGDA